MELAPRCLPFYFYPRPPRGGRPTVSTDGAALGEFLSTPSARRATGNPSENPQSLRISIHALREEGDRPRSGRMPPLRYFYPRPPRGGRRRFPLRNQIHCHFYPRPPRGGRLKVRARSGKDEVFLSTPSARRATENPYTEKPLTVISIHALREEGDGLAVCSPYSPAQFLSTPSARRATSEFVLVFRWCTISIHALREEGDLNVRSCLASAFYFYPRPPRGGRPANPCFSWLRCYFYPRPPRGGRLDLVSAASQIFRFLSTPSARRATSMFVPAWLPLSISIHALREEGDGRC